MQVTSERCDLNLTECEHFDVFSIRDVCRVMQMRNQIWSEFYEHTEPRIQCPFKKTTIKLINAPFDLGYVAHLPLAGYTWKFIGKAFKSVGKVRPKKRLIFCIMYIVTIKKKIAIKHR